MLRLVSVLPFVLAVSTAFAQSAPDTSQRGTVALLPVTASGVDPIVPNRVGAMIRTVMGSLGYDAVPDDAVARAIAAVRASDHPAPADVWRITVLANAQRGVHVVVGVEGDGYVADIFVASADGSGPFRSHVVGSPTDFLSRCAASLRSIVPAPSTFDADAARRYSTGFGTAQGISASQGWSTFTPSRPIPIARPSMRTPRYGVTFLSESAFGHAGNTRFYNHILGPRFDIQVGDNVVLGAFAGYVNLDRGSFRASNVLGYLQLEDRLRFYSTGRVRFPLRLGFGYLPRNGPFLRFSAGIRFPAGEHFEIGLDLLAPTFWWVPGDRYVTYDIGAELTYRFGPPR